MRIRSGVLVAAVALALAPAATASAHDPYPHEFRNNMGYCAPYLAQLTLPDGSRVRPFINHTVQALTHGDAAWLGWENLGDFASDKAQSTTDQQCLQRSL